MPDAEVRRNAIVEIAAQLGLTIYPKLVEQAEENSPSLELGHKLTQNF